MSQMSGILSVMLMHHMLQGLKNPLDSMTLTTASAWFDRVCAAFNELFLAMGILDNQLAQRTLLENFPIGGSCALQAQGGFISQ